MPEISSHMVKNYQILIVISCIFEIENYTSQLRLDETVTYRVMTVDQVKEILIACQSQPIDSILLECSPPDFSGLSLLGQLQQQMGENCPPVVVIGNGDAEVAVQAFKNGATDYLIKERMTPDKLRLTMQGTIQNAQLRRREFQRYHQQFQTSVENMLDSFGIFSAIRDNLGQIIDFRIDYLNGAACENNQIPKEMQIGRRLCELLPKHRESGLFHDYCQVVETGEPLTKESFIYEDICEEKRLVGVFDIRATKFNDGFVASWRDVTERKQLEIKLSQTIEKLQKQQHRLQRLIDQAPIGIGIAAATGEVKVMNDAMLALHKYTREEFERHSINWYDFTPPEFYENTQQGLEQLRKDGFLPPQEQEIVRGDGSRIPIWFSATQLLDSADEYVAFAIDLSQQKQAEAAIKELNQNLAERIAELQVILDLTPVGIAIASDPDCTQIQSNAYIRRLLEITPGTNISQSAIDDEPPSYRIFQNGEEVTAENLPMQVAARLGVEVREQEFDLLVPNGKIHQMLAYATPLRGEQNHIRGAVGVFLDVTERHQTTVALKASQQRYRELAEAMPQMVWTADATGTVNYWNQRWSQYTGLSQEESLALGCMSMVHPDDQERTLEKWHQSLNHGQPFDIEFRIRNTDNVYHWFISRAIPIRDHQEKITGWIGTITDIDQQKQLEARLRLVLDAVNGLIFDWNLITNDVYRSEKLFDLIGVHPEDAPGNSFWWQERIHPDDLRGLQQKLQELLANGSELYEVEYRVRHEHGHWVDVWERGCLVRDQQGQIIRIVGSTVDISDRKRVELECQRSEAVLQGFIAASPIGFALFDRELRFLYANEALAKINGLSLSQVLGRTLWEVVPEIAPQFAPMLRQIMATQEPVLNLEFNGEVRPGVFRSTIGNHYPVCLSNGELIGLGVALIDVSELNQAQQELKESEQRFRDLADNISQFAWMADETGWILWYNKRWFDYTGTSLEEMQGWSWQKVHHPDYVEPVTNKFRACIQAGETWEDSFPIRGKDGQYRWFLSRAIPLRDEQGKIIRWFGTNTDITELQEAEKKLQKSETEFRTISNAAPALVWVCNREGEITFFNQRWYEYTGQTEAEASGHGWVETMHPDDAPQILAHWERCQKTGEIYEGEVRYRRHDGEYCWHTFRALPRWGASGEIESWYGVSINISARKEAEHEREKLLAQQRQYTQQLQGLTTAALAINSALTVEEVLKVMTDQAASIIGAHQSITSMTIDQNWANSINAVYLSDKYAQWQDYYEKPDGSGIYAWVCHWNRPMRMTEAELDSFMGNGQVLVPQVGQRPPMRGWLAAPLVARDGHNIGLINLSDKYEGEFTASDESILIQLAQMASVAVENVRLYEAEQQARAAAEAARETAESANRIKDEFLAVLSHELRSPLNPILGWSKLLQSRKLSEAKIAEGLATIERNAKLQTQLIDDLLDISKILRGKLTLNVEPVNLCFVIEAAIDTVRTAAIAKSISLRPVLPNIGQVSGDAARLQQIVWNLLSNAIKFSPQGGRVDICLQRVGDQAKITVKDTGKGINSDFLPHIFESFRQEDASTTRKFGGLGLGLAIVRQLVEAHGGTITADSPGEGLGATFTVQLPLVNLEPELEQTETTWKPEFNLTGMKVLIVDDEPDARELLAVILTQYGAKTTTVSSAMEALVTLESYKPNLLISDIGMANIDGYSLIKQIRDLSPEQGGEILAIALTAYAGEIDCQQAIAAGFHRHLTKPVEPEVLISTIADILD
jgi:PAS domain S-box-containing protein